MNKYELLKQLYFTNIVTYELKKQLNITSKEYKELEKKLLEYYELPNNYRRTPQLYGKYIKDSYMIIQETETDMEILGYYPSRKLAEEICPNECIIKQATDQVMIEYIHNDIYSLNWEDLQYKYKIGYHKLHQFLKIVKEKEGITKVNKNKKQYIYENKKLKYYYIRKMINGEYKNYGTYKNYDEAVNARNYLKNNSWNYEELQLHKILGGL